MRKILSVKRNFLAQFLLMQQRIPKSCKTMQLYIQPTESELTDILSLYKGRYALLLRLGCNKEQFDTCSQAIKFLKKEIEKKKNVGFSKERS